MSAFVVSDDHLRLLVQAALQLRPYGGTFAYYHAAHGTTNGATYRVGDAEADATVAMLYAANVASVNARYGEDDPEDNAPRYATAYDGAIPPVLALKAVRCYEYQSSERADWEASRAAAFCRALAAVLVVAMPGFDAAPWCYSKAENNGWTP